MNGALRLVPLGGLGEFGLNAMVLEWQDDLLLIDAGVMFPGGESLGVDSIVPDFEYVRQRAAGLRGIVLTHGHEDHIGALSHALAAAPAPVYGSRLTLGFARKRLQERGVRADLRTLTRNVSTVVGDVQTVTGTVRQGVELVQTVRAPRAILAGIRAGASVLGRVLGRKDGKGDHHGSQI